MASQTKHYGIIVGVDGSPASDSAVSWAAHDAAMHGVTLTLIWEEGVPRHHREQPRDGHGRAEQKPRALNSRTRSLSALQPSTHSGSSTTGALGLGLAANTNRPTTPAATSAPAATRKLAE